MILSSSPRSSHTPAAGRGSSRSRCRCARSWSAWFRRSGTAWVSSCRYPEQRASQVEGSGPHRSRESRVRGALRSSLRSSALGRGAPRGYALCSRRPHEGPFLVQPHPRTRRRGHPGPCRLCATGGRRRRRWWRQRLDGCRNRDVRRGLRRHGRPGRGRSGRRASSTSSRCRPTWANYGEIISAFAEKYDIKVNSAQPDAASQDEINAADQLAGTDRAPDVFDLGQSVALANTDMFAPYQVETWDDIPAEFKDPDGAWVNDYGGYMSIGYDSSVVPEVTSVDGPARPGLQGQGRPERQPDRGRRRVQRRGHGLGRQRRLGRRHRARRRLLQASSTTPATCCRSTRPPRPSSPGRPPWSSTGTT